MRSWLTAFVCAEVPPELNGMQNALNIQREQMNRMSNILDAAKSPPGGPAKGSTVTFKNPAAKKFLVDGKKIPDVNFDAGPSWSGLMPISGAKNETRKLFFWFWPANNPSDTKDLVFWTNGGPGCSSLEGFLQENGPISWSWGQSAPTPNPWSWTNLSHVLWVEQPVGTGFSQGAPSISNDDQLGEQLMGFLEQFLEVFSELKGNNLWLTGESYAGFYVPYIANWIYEHPGLDLSLKGIWIADPSLSYGLVQQEIPALRFAQANKNLFPFNSSFWAQLQHISDTCGYTDYLDKFVTYPPAGQLPLVATNGTFTVTSSCRIHSPIQRAVGVLNPVFDKTSAEDLPHSTDVQDAIHAPHISWDSCTNTDVYVDPVTGGPGRDLSIPSTLSVLPNVIDKSVRTVIVHGLADFILIAEGTRIAIQNMTWGGAQGFQTPIESETFTYINQAAIGFPSFLTSFTQPPASSPSLAMSVEMLPKHLTGQLDVLMIDNFDSFTWNLYQQLSLHGADVTVIRNDSISPSLFSQLNIKSLIISPGPGHPQTDSGISSAAIEYFQGKVPVLGVCMGLECLVDLYGGQIGCSQIRGRNYAWQTITSATEESGVIMGVRHRKYTVEAVQYHPESILSEGGNDLIRNFLSLRGGLWEENPEARVLDNTLPPFPFEALPNEIASKPGATTKVPSILEKIYAQRLADVAQAQATPGTTLADLETLLSLNIAPPLIPFVPRIKETLPGQPALFAEIKRASPSKGPISVSTSPAKQALTYALSGAHTISVLTEPKWFLGSLQDMLHARLSVTHLPNRPAILRKDFILSRYQIIEARLWGADTILLIVSMLPEALLKDLYAFSLELGMEPLVEVNNAKEMEIALSLGAKVIGVNNRNLHDFQVDMGTTSRLSDMVVGKDVILCALSGISTADDVKRYASEGVGAVLIGESLMRAKDTAAFVRELFSLPPAAPQPPMWHSRPPLVKICGIRSKEEALSVAAAGADFLGLMFVEKSKRTIDIHTAKEVSQAIRHLRFESPAAEEHTNAESIENAPWFTTHATRMSLSHSSPLLVGVFQDAPLDVIIRTVADVQLDIVQLHGSEPTDWSKHIPVPVIRVFHVGKFGKGVENITRGGAHKFVLLDSLREDGSGVSGGSGKVIDWDLAKNVVEDGEIVVNSFSSKVTPKNQDGEAVTADKPVPTGPTQAPAATNQGEIAAPVPQPAFPLPIILAGGLSPNNVAAAIAHVQPWAVDVSGGVENEDGTGKDLEKVKAFINQAKGLTSTVEEIQGEENGREESESESEEANEN
ncbi:hypothetical protein GALMADRAFT_211511 [Galerina marginata CBS 339.88]|uniref:Multifunctional tryptophan biosynthesis protein n=1 Tax=Galerina marginata (strain CBS 339.88) TaxID=685588 RepID=A0A067SYU8_GALM3|nr:hypothetical protein GALMADRAFT_211511 [Galerina marginata CBS 339.88]